MSSFPALIGNLYPINMRILTAIKSFYRICKPSKTKVDAALQEKKFHSLGFQTVLADHCNIKPFMATVSSDSQAVRFLQWRSL